MQGMSLWNPYVWIIVPVIKIKQTTHELYKVLRIFNVSLSKYSTELLECTSVKKYTVIFKLDFFSTMYKKKHVIYFFFIHFKTFVPGFWIMDQIVFPQLEVQMSVFPLCSPVTS